MLNRDYSKPMSAYLKKNRIWLIITTLVLVVGLVIALIFGMNVNHDFKGYNEFSIEINTSQIKKFTEHEENIASIVNSYGGNIDTISLFGEGDNSKIIVRYNNALSNKDESIINNKIADKMNIEINLISEHVDVAGKVKANDYLFSAAAILLLVVIASIFAYFRYNGASAVTIIISCVLGTWGYMAVGSILRLTIGMSYFAMLFALNLLILYFAIDIFEHMRAGSMLGAGDYSAALKDAIKHSKVRAMIVSIAILLIGILFIMVAPEAIKFLSQNIMFIAVLLLFTVLYIIPFIWSLLVPYSRRVYKVKASNDKKD